jgi:hypothetical protein
MHVVWLCGQLLLLRRSDFQLLFHKGVIGVLQCVPATCTLLHPSLT